MTHRKVVGSIAALGTLASAFAVSASVASAEPISISANINQTVQLTYGGWSSGCQTFVLPPNVKINQLNNFSVYLPTVQSNAIVVHNIQQLPLPISTLQTNVLQVLPVMISGVQYYQTIIGSQYYLLSSQITNHLNIKIVSSL
ncbi:hypothetical protein [Pasteuria penetrans]|uniref:hypothetical protein n=1 Tax=Pasteuria penetrans TaxID=86005 RepID=UPI000FBC1874|nr:hypothetical protein [Pasteuria penetrans]